MECFYYFDAKVGDLVAFKHQKGELLFWIYIFFVIFDRWVSSIRGFYVFLPLLRA
jgi:hypothetical protein